MRATAPQGGVALPLKRILPILLIPVLVLSGILLGGTLTAPDARLSDNTASYPLRLSGVYTLSDSPVQQPFTPTTVIPADRLHTLTVYGHFDREVKPGEQVVMHVSNLRVTLTVNREDVFNFGMQSSNSLRGPGVVWTAFTSTGIQPADMVTLTLANVYANESLSSFDDFFQSLSGGSEYRVYRAAILSQSGAMLIASAVILLGVCMVTVAQISGCGSFQ